MPIEVSCVCGRRLRAKDELAGRTGKCPNCGAMLTIAAPAGMAQARNDQAAERAAPPPPRLTAPRSPLSALADRLPLHLMRYVYGVLLLALIPLAISTLRPAPRDDVNARFVATVRDHEELADQIIKLVKGNASVADLLAVFPGDRIEGAWLPQDTWMHWVLALASAGVYLGLILLIFPGEVERPWQLAAVSLFTATIGIMLLLALQYVANFTQGYWMRGTGWITLLFYVIKFIGYSYHAALDPDSNIVLSGLGFMCGVGLCEEFFKSLPALLHFTHSRTTWGWRTACAFGLASGIGFGVSEGIRYASSDYNGLMTGGIYGVRFISCVALHGLWTGGAAIAIYRRRNFLQRAKGFANWLQQAITPLIVPIVLHGMYDTLLKKEMAGWSLAVAVLTFGWFVWQVESMPRLYDRQERYIRGGSVGRFA